LARLDPVPLTQLNSDPELFEQVFQCGQCEVSVGSEYLLKVHEKTHVTEATPCNLCGKVVKVRLLASSPLLFTPDMASDSVPYINPKISPQILVVNHGTMLKYSFGIFPKIKYLVAVCFPLFLDLLFFLNLFGFNVFLPYIQ
jgi:hypothetical protein